MKRKYPSDNFIHTISETTYTANRGDRERRYSVVGKYNKEELEVFEKSKTQGTEPVKISDIVITECRYRMSYLDLKTYGMLERVKTVHEEE